MRTASRLLTTTVLFVLLVGATTAPAQGIWTEPHGDRNLTLEFVPPALERVEFTNLHLERWRPGLQVRVPVGDLGDVLESTIALSIGVDLD
ncbi:MAG: hypothetical protein GY838_05125 [bacterium]|nr:hypothetical protein [bacterium]